MDIKTAVQSFAALAQETRLKTFRLLVEAGPTGLAAGDISAELAIPHNTLSFHLSHLCHAGLVVVHKRGRNNMYSAQFAQTEALIQYLVEQCCQRKTTQVSVHNAQEKSTV